MAPTHPRHHRTLPLLLAPTLRRTAPGRLPELMDRPDCDRALLADALEAIADTNRWTGGDRLQRRELLRLLDGARPGGVVILDVGAGNGDASLRLARRLRRLGWEPRVLLADLHGMVLDIARERLQTRLEPEEMEAFRFVRLDGPDLPLADRSVDVALCATTLHHLERRPAGRFLKELCRVSRRGWVVTDLRRSRLSYAAVRLLSVTVWRRNPLNRADGPVSVRRAFTPREIRALLEEAGVTDVRVRGHLARLSIRWVAPRRGAAGSP